MTTQRTNPSQFGLAALLNNTTGAHSYLSVNPSQNTNKIIDIGGGFGNGAEERPASTASSYLGSVNSFNGAYGQGSSYGEWTLIPTRTFSAQVKLWGGGGGAHSQGGNSFAGGGGHARADINFLEGIPYTFWVGQGGFYSQGRYSTNENKFNYRTSGTFGNGGGGGHNAGSGGGLSGIFFNTLGFESQGSGHDNQGGGTSQSQGGVSTWFRTPSQNNALLIAGGGGGAGHNSQSHHGQGGGGGGVNGNPGHNSPGGTQTGGGAAWTNGSQNGHALHGGHGGNGSHAGGGGGGWFGGAGGSHSGSHYNGGGGGSGHALDQNSVSGFRNFWIKQQRGDIVQNSVLEVSPSNHGTYVNMAAGRSDIDWQYAGIGAGAANHNSSTDTMKFLGFHGGWRNGTNGRIVIRVNE